jgi:hypothetical protein
MIMVTKRARERARVAIWMVTATKRARARAARGMCYIITVLWYLFHLSIYLGCPSGYDH